MTYYDTWAAMIPAHNKQPPTPGQHKGLAFFGPTADEAERGALQYLEGQGIVS